MIRRRKGLWLRPQKKLMTTWSRSECRYRNKSTASYYLCFRIMASTEDAQPNEIRLARKGITRVPTIRSTRSFTPKGSPRGFGRTRGAPHIAGLNPSHRDQCFGSGSVHTPPSPSSVTPHNVGESRKRSLSGDLAGPSKRLRIEPSSAAPRPLDSLHSRRKKKAAEETIMVSIELPPECRKGAPRCNSRRSGWLRSQSRILDTEKKLEVISHSFKGSVVHFRCRPQASQYSHLDSSGDAIDTGAVSHNTSRRTKDDTSVIDFSGCSRASALETYDEIPQLFVVRRGRVIRLSLSDTFCRIGLPNRTVVCI